MESVDRPILTHNLSDLLGSLTHLLSTRSVSSESNRDTGRGTGTGTGTAPKRRLEFLDSITVSRTNRDRTLFARSWNAEETGEKLCKRDRPHTYVEFLAPDERGKHNVGKMYLDRDRYVGIEQPSADTIWAEEELVREHVQALVDRMKTDRNDLSYVLATRHGFCEARGEYKLSFRPYIQGMSIRLTDIPRVLRMMKQTGFWDMSVYKDKEQLLAAIHGCKGTVGGVFDGRVLQHEPGFDDPLLYVVQHVEEGWEHLDLPEDYYPDAISIRSDPSSGSERTDSMLPEAECHDPAFVRDLVSCLAASLADDRQSWVKIAIILKRLGGGGETYLDDWLVFSRLSSKYDNDMQCVGTWGGLNTVQSRVNPACMGSLRWYASHNQMRYKLAVKAMLERRRRDVRGQLFDDSSCSGALAGGEMVGGDGLYDRTSSLRAALSELDSGIFGACTREGFHIRMTAKLVCVITDPSIKLRVEWVIPDVYVDGHLIGEIAGGVLSNFNQCNVNIDKNLSFAMKRDFDTKMGRDNTQLTCTGQGSDGLQVVLNNFSTTDPKGTLYLPSKRPMPMRLHDTKTWVEAVMDQVCRHVDLALGELPGSAAIMLQFNVQTLNVYLANNVVAAGGESDVLSDSGAIGEMLWEAAQKEGLRKLDGWVYKPIDGCPCAYERKFDYMHFINTACRNNSVYNNNPKRFDDAMKFLTYYESDRMPTLVVDWDLMSFSNGVLELATGTFTNYHEMGAEEENRLSKRVARHHISQPYTCSTNTPLLDVILNSQFEPDVAELLMALIGRCFFKVGQRDGWQVMPFLVGVGGTGKSLLLNVVAALFAPGAVGTLAAKREELFGMANLVDKELVLGRDMPAKMSASLPQEIMQSMTAGEDMEIPRKGRSSLHQRWTAPMIMAGNHMPDYVNTGNNVGRRMVSIRFDNVVADPQEDLQESIMKQELPNIVCRSLHAYSTHIVRVKAGGGSLWKHVPSAVLEWRDTLSAATNKMAEFLAMADDERGCALQQEDGAITFEVEFKAAFVSKMGSCVKYTLDTAVLASHGFRLAKDHMCKSCHQLSKGGAAKCCELYSTRNRIQKNRIYNMLIVYATSPMEATTLGT